MPGGSLASVMVTYGDPSQLTKKLGKYVPPEKATLKAIKASPLPLRLLPAAAIRYCCLLLLQLLLSASCLLLLLLLLPLLLLLDTSLLLLLLLLLLLPVMQARGR